MKDDDFVGEDKSEKGFLKSILLHSEKTLLMVFLLILMVIVLVLMSIKLDGRLERIEKQLQQVELRR